MAKSDKKALSVLTNGIMKENPVLKLVLGTCPTLAVTTMARNAIGMGIAATFVLLGSNIVISLIRKIVPDKVRIPVFITVIAGFTTIVDMLLHAYLPDVYKVLGIYIPLIVVNCIIFARAEMFASKNGVVASILDALGMGAGFTIALLIMGSVREILGAGTWMGIPVTKNLFDPAVIMILPPGGFLAFGFVVAVIQKLSVLKVRNKEIASGETVSGCDMNCAGCAAAHNGGDK
ncbi:electron transport complex subunit RsxE [Thermoclostridium stercorarium]|uniref:electron transport complex subunit RsxE n=1 Tax=Thermoclostridium stercorarium TaxID=1510 RepID=UPI0006D048DD|nr:electron transport complex subunit E [Thermoclostridium stercorarium]